MKQIIIMIMVLIFSSCSSNKSIQTDKVKEKITIDSSFNHILTNKNIEIEWIMSDDTMAVPYLPGQNETASKKIRKLTPQKIPKYGKIRIRITHDSIRSKGKVKVAEKKITKTKKKKQNHMLKPQRAKNHFNFLYIIIFAFCVKFLWNNRKIFKKIWNFIK